jgi:hypothetical protein
VSESNLHPKQEAQKRRTTRIVQAVPLNVTGVDALGRPFQERTSTLIVNCHGCRYQSKHYVLKNMWVTLEVPHSEAGREPRSVRGRVTWIQRPRTVRELFQVGLELEVSGNVWGIAFPPPDWFPFPESGTPLEIPASPPPAKPGPEDEDWSTDEGIAPPVASESVQNNVRVLPLPTSEESPSQLSQQLARLVAEAKQQIQSAVRESANEAAATETRMLLADVHAQLMDAAKKSAAAAVAAQVEEAKQETQRQRQVDRDAALSSLRQEMARELSELIGQARHQVDSQLAQVESARQMDFEVRIQNQLQTAIQRIETATRALEARENETRVTMEQMRLSSEQAAANELRLWQEQMDQRAAEAQARLAEMDRTAKALKDQIAAAAAIGEAGWRGVLDTELEVANERWRERAGDLIDEASRQAAEKFGKSAEVAASQIEKQFEERIAAISEAHAQAAAEAEDTLAMFRATMNQETARGEGLFTQLQQAVAQMEAKRREFSAYLESSSEHIAQRGQAILETQSADLARQAEAIVGGLTERFQSTLEAGGRKTVDDLLGQFHERLAPQVARIEEASNKLMFDREQAERALAEHQERVWQASDRNLQDTVSRGKELLAQIESDFGESARETVSRWISEMETKATETTQATFEALYKSADWYEKKVQNQMQTTLQKGVDQSAAHLREKAAELSGLFARELDNCSRSYVEHAQTQIQESAAEAAERGRQQISEAGDAAAANFTERAAQLGREQLDAYAARTKTAFDQNVASMEATIAQIRSRLESDARGFAVEFQRALSQHVQQTLEQGMQDLAAQIQQAKEELVSESQAIHRQFRLSLEPLGNAAMDEHKKRLENASKAWLLTTVTKLTQQSEARIGELTESTERKLRAVCSAVIAEMGASLRQRLGGLAAPFEAPSAPGSPDPGGNPPKK